MIAALLAALAGLPAQAASTFATDRVAIELFAETNALPAEGGTIWLALREEIIPDWHTYWENPGDSGEPTDIEWDLPPGFEAGEIRWPPPLRIPYGPLVNFGFEDEAILLVPLTVPGGLTPGERVTLRAHAYWLVCAEVCVPEDGAVEITLRVGTGAPEVNLAAADIFARARQGLPQPSPWEARFDEADGTLRVALLGAELEAPLAEGRISAVSLFPDAPGLIDNAADQIVRYGADGMTISIPSGALFRRDAAPETLRGLIVIDEIIAGEELSRAIRFEAANLAPPATAATQLFSNNNGHGSDIGFGVALLFALIGGLILNLMPCVFPIVFLKALTFVSVAHERPWKVRFHGLFYTGGILASFSFVALLLLALRAGGAQIGWGFQLQSPQVVAAFAFLLFVIGLNLSGIFTIGTSVMGLGGSLAERRGYSGSFLTGVLAVIVATPCTAPFMGLALGFALTQPALTGFAVFLALGFGLALPYLLLSFAPALLRMLPRPGPWMERLKQILAVPIYAWVVYLLWVLAQQVSMTTVAAALVGLLVLAIAAWLYETFHIKAPSGYLRLASLVVLVAGMSVAVVVLPHKTSTDASAEVADVFPSVPYSETRLGELREEGQTVFVNFTAAWCITCLLNERVVFADADFVRRFEASGTIYMKGDWTNRDAEIARALERFGRPGVPLYVVYRSGREPQVLPQILTADIVLNAIEDR